FHDFSIGMCGRRKQYPTLRGTSKRTLFLPLRVESCYLLVMRTITHTQNSNNSVLKLDSAEVRDGVSSVLQKLPKTEAVAVMVLGDIGLDEYVMGPVRRISPEAPVPVV